MVRTPAARETPEGGPAKRSASSRGPPSSARRSGSKTRTSRRPGGPPGHKARLEHAARLALLMHASHDCQATHASPCPLSCEHARSSCLSQNRPSERGLQSAYIDERQGRGAVRPAGEGRRPSAPRSRIRPLPDPRNLANISATDDGCEATICLGSAVPHARYNEWDAVASTASVNEFDTYRWTKPTRTQKTKAYSQRSAPREAAQVYEA